MIKRLEILKGSLAKKNKRLDEAFSTHFADVKSANGQPLNDKRNGQQTLDRWDRQNDKIRMIKTEIEKTERAIEREKSKIDGCENSMIGMPSQIVNLVNSGVLIQWRKHPNTFFVEGVDKARIQFKDGKLLRKFTSSIEGEGQFRKFRDIFNNLKASLEAKEVGK